MKHDVIAFTLAMAMALSIGCQHGETTNGPTQYGRAQEEPLLLLDDAPLLLDEEGEASAGPIADNSRCHHCHLNYMDEELAVVHAKANMGCADCHGASDTHIADESWAEGGNGTAPDIIYRLEEINPACLNCHDIDSSGLEEHTALLAGEFQKGYCTECHGNHRLWVRKLKWK